MKTFIRDNFTPPKSNSLSDSSVKPRLEYVDLAKGICIILVVIMHGIPSSSFYPLELLRMPLYFMLSGMFFKCYDSFGIFLSKKVNNLILPLLLFDLIYLIFNNLYSFDFRLSEYFMVFNGVVHNVPLWFLVALAMISVIYYFTYRLTFKLRLIALFLFPILSLYLIHDNNIHLSYYISESLWGLPFFVFGNSLASTPVILNSHNDGHIAILSSIILLLIFSVISYYDISYAKPCVDIEIESLVINPISYYLLCFIIVITFLNICKYIKWLPIISYCGRYSIIILGMHYIYLEHLNTPFYILTGKTFGIFEIILLTIICSWLSIPFFRKYFPYFTAQKNLFEAMRRRWATPVEELAVK